MSFKRQSFSLRKQPDAAIRETLSKGLGPHHHHKYYYPPQDRVSAGCCNAVHPQQGPWHYHHQYHSAQVPVSAGCCNAVDPQQGPWHHHHQYYSTVKMQCHQAAAMLKTLSKGLGTINTNTIPLKGQCLQAAVMLSKGLGTTITNTIPLKIQCLQAADPQQVLWHHQHQYYSPQDQVPAGCCNDVDPQQGP